MYGRSIPALLPNKIFYIIQLRRLQHTFPVEFFIKRREQFLRIEHSRICRQGFVRRKIRLIRKKIAQVCRRRIVLVEVGRTEDVPEGFENRTKTKRNITIS